MPNHDQPRTYPPHLRQEETLWQEVTQKTFALRNLVATLADYRKNGGELPLGASMAFAQAEDVLRRYP